jgi:hypothetical protein
VVVCPGEGVRLQTVAESVGLCCSTHAATAHAAGGGFFVGVVVVVLIAWHVL